MGRIFEDIRHQMQAPLNKVPPQIDEAFIMPRFLHDADLRKHRIIVRGLCHKANGISRSVGLLADIEARRPIKPKQTPLECFYIKRLLAQLAEDHEMQAEPEFPVWFSVDSESLDHIPWTRFTADRDLMEQAFFCLYDNALKYSWARTRVRISARMTKSGQLCITLANQGPKVTPQEARKVLERGARGYAAYRFVGEGSGLGLYLVAEILLAHKGEFKLQPTDDDGWTRAECLFPCGPKFEKL